VERLQEYTRDPGTAKGKGKGKKEKGKASATAKVSLEAVLDAWCLVLKQLSFKKAPIPPNLFSVIVGYDFQTVEQDIDFQTVEQTFKAVSPETWSQTAPKFDEYFDEGVANNLAHNFSIIKQMAAAAFHAASEVRRLDEIKEANELPKKDFKEFVITFKMLSQLNMRTSGYIRS